MDKRTQSREIYIMNEMISKCHHLEKWLDENHKGQYKIAGLFLQGSQNYNLDFFGDANEGTSDVDVKAYVISGLDVLIDGRKPISKIIRFDDDSQIEIKDIRLLPGLLKSGAMNYMEMFFTQWSLINHDIPHIQELMDMSARISRINPRASMKYMLGVADNQFRRLNPDTNLSDLINDYEAGIIDEGSMSKKQLKSFHALSSKERSLISKYGYYPKALYHIYRMRWLMEDFFVSTDMDFSLAMSGYSREGHQQVESMRKFHLCDGSSKEEAIALAQEALDFMYSTADRIEESLAGLNDSVCSDLRSIVHDMVKDSAISDVHSENRRAIF